MKTVYSPDRPDDPRAVMNHKDAYLGGRALVVLGGPSGARWKDLERKIKPDVVLGGNGVIMKIDSLDYWMLAENMTRSAKLAAQGDTRYRQMMGMFSATQNARYKLISHRSWHLSFDKTGCIRIRRKG